MGKRAKDNKDSKDIKLSGPKQVTVKSEVKTQVEEIDNTDEAQLARIFGISDFTTSKNKSHIDSDVFGVFKGSKVKSKFRQYMNRKGGFNKVLDKSN